MSCDVPICLCLGYDCRGNPSTSAGRSPCGRPAAAAAAAKAAASSCARGRRGARGTLAGERSVSKASESPRTGTGVTWVVVAVEEEARSAARVGCLWECRGAAPTECFVVAVEVAGAGGEGPESTKLVLLLSAAVESEV